jgi:hypothetical protein
MRKKLEGVLPKERYLLRVKLLCTFQAGGIQLAASEQEDG